MMDLPSQAAIRRAAEMRLLGSPWSEIAGEVGYSEADVRVWPRLFDRRWFRAMRRAERRVYLTAGLEALTALRGLLRSDDEKTRRDAAKTLADIRLKMGGDDPPPGDVAVPSLAHLDDDALDALIAEG